MCSGSLILWLLFYFITFLVSTKRSIDFPFTGPQNQKQRSFNRDGREKMILRRRNLIIILRQHAWFVKQIDERIKANIILLIIIAFIIIEELSSCCYYVSNNKNNNNNNNSNNNSSYFLPQLHTNKNWFYAFLSLLLLLIM